MKKPGITLPISNDERLPNPIPFNSPAIPEIRGVHRTSKKEVDSRAQMLITPQTTPNLFPSPPSPFSLPTTTFFYSFNIHIFSTTPHHSRPHPVSRHPHQAEMSSTGNSNPPFPPSFSRKMERMGGKGEKKIKKGIKYFSSLFTPATGVQAIQMIFVKMSRRVMPRDHPKGSSFPLAQRLWWHRPP
ncbi:hypothetical protein AVEN_203446-1 [Araneus ventricosus]|uniref:Uncharacterized protein n=1 Tax=Araneus ventricosus TaxID=182803 RepID=A0A4Y2BGE1_ARAVE|nr:hypothetical protein AVEN_203446-1 [Araneus ventricosus]